MVRLKKEILILQENYLSKNDDYIHVQKLHTNKNNIKRRNK